MNTKLQRTLHAITTRPVPPNVKWDDIEAFFIALGAELSESRGSRVRVKLNGIVIVFHRLHPSKETDKGALISVYKFLKMAGFL